MATIELNPGEDTLVRIALRYWVEGCKSEAKTMDGWQIEYAEKGDTETSEKCRRNAAASRKFEVEAEALYKKFLTI